MINLTDWSNCIEANQRHIPNDYRSASKPPPTQSSPKTQTTSQDIQELLLNRLISRCSTDTTDASIGPPARDPIIETTDPQTSDTHRNLGQACHPTLQERHTFSLDSLPRSSPLRLHSCHHYPPPLVPRAEKVEEKVCAVEQ
eukprot:3941630-Rhodomonas_salina.2